MDDGFYFFLVTTVVTCLTFSFRALYKMRCTSCKLCGTELISIQQVDEEAQNRNDSRTLSSQVLLPQPIPNS